MSKAMFPPLASFGPFFMVIGSAIPRYAPATAENAWIATWGFAFAGLGAIMTALALTIVFKAVNALEAASSGRMESIKHSPTTASTLQ